MIIPSRALALVVLVLAAGCTTPESYPISEEQCGPGDPVQDLRPPNCLPQI